MPRQFEKPDVAGGPFRLGEWLVEPSLNRLSRGDTTIQLELKVMDVLVCLAERAGEMVTRIEIIDRVWATEFIADNTLTHAINEIRTALGDDARNPSFIETIHRRGYRLIVAVELEQRPAGAVAQFPSRAGMVVDDERSPYPGLAAFTEADAEFFFGREAEVAQMWRKLTSRRLLAVIGPSGVGKSSFLRAGVIPAKPEGWGVLVCQPGEAPFAALAGALAPAFEGDVEAFSRATEFERNAVHLFTRWREQHDRALLIVDQFEELFTLNPAETQHRFASLVSRLAREADVHVLLSLRDDFLYRCQSLDPLHPVLDGLVALQQPNPDSLKRALVEPARRFDFDFEDDRLASEMIAQVEGERGALPMLAFAVARLWGKRDRENKTLTRQACGDIGGVGGALARHAESTMQSIGNARRPMVREIFRNLVTSQGTRAVRSVDDLMSVFAPSMRDAALAVLRRLINARLLTSFEEEDAEGHGRHRVEIVHESLLSAWPRLVGWQTQDADSARLRDELRQAARTWDEHGRTDDMLWTGAAYREFASWRERYPGGLSDLEQAFANAMTALAARRRRRRRLAAAATFALLLAVLAVVGTLWSRSVVETRRAEAAKLLVLGELELEKYPTAALAWANKSMELRDSSQVRMLALRALAHGPPVRVLEPTASMNDGFFDAAMSPNGEWLATSDMRVRLWNQNGADPFDIGYEADPGERIGVAFVNDEILTTEMGVKLRWWSIPTGRRVERPERELSWKSMPGGDSLTQFSEIEALDWIHWWPYETGAPKIVGWHADYWNDIHDNEIGDFLAYPRGNRVLLRNYYHGGSPSRDFSDRQIGTHLDIVRCVAFHPSGEYVAAWDTSGVLRFWSITGSPKAPLRTVRLDGVVSHLLFSPTGDWLAAQGVVEDSIVIWLLNLHAPIGAAPLRLKRTDARYPNALAFDSADRWLVSVNYSSLGFWHVDESAPWVFEVGGTVCDVEFSPDGERVYSLSSQGSGEGAGQLRAWSLGTNEDPPYKVLLTEESRNFYGSKIVFDPSGKHMALSTRDGRIFVIEVANGRVKVLPGSSEYTPRSSIFMAFKPTENRLASVPRFAQAKKMVIQIWDLETGESQIVGNVSGQTSYLGFADNEHLVWAGSEFRGGSGGERIFDLRTGTEKIVSTGGFELFRAVGPSGSFKIVGRAVDEANNRKCQLSRVDGSPPISKQINSHGQVPQCVAVHPTGEWIATGSHDDFLVRVGPANGGDPYLFFGHEGPVWSVKFSPDGQWIASSSEDGTVRVWPMPDLSNPPLHTLPHDELIAKLKTLTNVRVIRDEDSPTGWKLTHDPFPGWETVPTW